MSVTGDEAPLLSVLIPVFNEELTIAELIDRVDAVAIDKEIIVVDDGSTDRTAEILHTKSARLRRIHESRVNLGKGLAIRIGLTYARGSVVVIQDADLELDPEEYHLLVGPILRHETNVVFGSRFKRPHGQRTPLRYAIVNRLLTSVANVLYRTALTDCLTAYKVCRTEVLRSLLLTSRGFEIEAELTAKLARTGERIVEVPISYLPRPAAQKKIRWQDAFVIAATLVRYRFSSDRSPTANRIRQ